MRWLIKIFYLLLFVVLAFVSFSFLHANSEGHQLKFLEWELMQSTVGIFILLSLGIGILIGMVASIPLVLGLRIQIKRMQKRLSDNQPSNLSSDPVVEQSA